MARLVERDALVEARAGVEVLEGVEDAAGGPVAELHLRVSAPGLHRVAWNACAQQFGSERVRSNVRPKPVHPFCEGLLSKRKRKGKEGKEREIG